MTQLINTLIFGALIFSALIGWLQCAIISLDQRTEFQARKSLAHGVAIVQLVFILSIFLRLWEPILILVGTSLIIGHALISHTLYGARERSNAIVALCFLIGLATAFSAMIIRVYVIASQIKNIN